MFFSEFSDLIRNDWLQVKLIRIRNNHWKISRFQTTALNYSLLMRLKQTEFRFNLINRLSLLILKENEMFYFILIFLRVSLNVKSCRISCCSKDPKRCFCFSLFVYLDVTGSHSHKIHLNFFMFKQKRKININKDELLCLLLNEKVKKWGPPLRFITCEQTLRHWEILFLNVVIVLSYRSAGWGEEVSRRMKHRQKDRRSMVDPGTPRWPLKNPETSLKFG